MSAPLKMLGPCAICGLTAAKGCVHLARRTRVSDEELAVVLAMGPQAILREMGVYDALLDLRDERALNAHLLIACKAAMEHCQFCSAADATIDVLRAALARARGETP